MTKTGKEWPVTGHWFGPHFSMFGVRFLRIGSLFCPSLPNITSNSHFLQLEICSTSFCHNRFFPGENGLGAGKREWRFFPLTWAAGFLSLSTQNWVSCFERGWSKEMWFAWNVEHGAWKLVVSIIYTVVLWRWWYNHTLASTHMSEYQLRTTNLGWALQPVGGGSRWHESVVKTLAKFKSMFHHLTKQFLYWALGLFMSRLWVTPRWKARMMRSLRSPQGLQHRIV